MYLWRKTAGPQWVKGHEEALQTHAHGELVIVRRPKHKHLELEIACRARSDSEALVKQFGGRVKALPRNWMEQFVRAEAKPVKIGKRLMIFNVRASLVSQRSRHEGRFHIIIPASLAFGTGQHVTTAMSLRFLEQVTRRWKRGWSLVDLGSGSGILSLAGKHFGAGRVTGIDNDPIAISMARSNARLNKIRGASFQLGDVRKWNSPQETDLTTANLYADLLMEILPKLRGGGWLILSGILRRQQDQLMRDLQRNHFEVVSTKCRGKWVAFLARRSCQPATPEHRTRKFLRPSWTTATVKTDAN